MLVLLLISGFSRAFGPPANGIRNCNQKAIFALAIGALRNQIS
jgi:hypothetical protein